MLPPARAAQNSGMDVAKVVRARGGVVPSARLINDGVKGHLIEKAVTRGTLVRIRRRWVALPDADPSLVAAARAGVVLSCVTQAKKARALGSRCRGRGRTSPRGPPCRPGLGASRTRRVHWAVPLVARHSSMHSRTRSRTSLQLVALLSAVTSERSQSWESAHAQGQGGPARAAPSSAVGSGASAVLDVAQPFRTRGSRPSSFPGWRWMKLRSCPRYGSRATAWTSSSESAWFCKSTVAIMSDISGNRHRT